MTLLSQLGYSPNKSKKISVPNVINPSDISIIIPVKDNQRGIDHLLREFANLVNEGSPAPYEVIVIGNFSSIPLTINKVYPFKVTHLECDKVGPAAARNTGASAASGSWLLFIDSDCTPTASTITGYSSDSNIHVAYAGSIEIETTDFLSKYYSAQETLIPPKAVDGKRTRPDYIVTANCLVLKTAYIGVGGFDESFIQAGGEDIDLGFKLLCIGSIEYQWNNIVQHSFEDGIVGFWKRFRRYGRGNRMLAEKYKLDLTPRPFTPNSNSLVNYTLALLQFFFDAPWISKKHWHSQVSSLSR